MARLQLRRGLNANLPTTSMLAGEPHFTTDRNNVFVATDATTKVPVTPPVDSLSTLSSVSGASDLIMIHDASEASGQMEKKMTFNAFKTALNIPASSTDELVAAVSGGTAGYIGGTDGSDGVVRGDSSITVAIDTSNDFVTLSVATVDGGTF